MPDGGRLILCGPAGSGKTEAVLAEYVECVRAHGEDAVVLLLPTRLAAERIRRRLVSEGRLPGLLDPRILTFPDLAELILSANHERVAAISDLQQRLLMRAVTDELCATGELRALADMCELPGFIDGLCGFVTELKRIAVRPEQFRERLAGSDVADERSYDLARIYEVYQARLQELGLYDDAGLFWWARDVLQRGERRPFEDLRVVLVDGFDDFTTTQLEVLAALASGGQRLLITLCLEADAERRPEVFRRPMRTLERLREQLGELPAQWLEAGEARGPLARMGERLFVEAEPEPIADAGDSVAIIEAVGQRAEVREVAVRVKRLILAGVPTDRIAIIARDLGGYARGLAEVCGRLGVPLRLHAGQPVGARPPVQAVLDILRAPAEGYRASHVMRLVKAAWLDPAMLGEGAPDPDEIERVCREANIIGGSGPEEWAARLRTYATRLRADLQRRRRGRADDEDEWLRGTEAEREAEIALVERVQAALTCLFDELGRLPAEAATSAYVERLAELVERFGVTEAVGQGADPHTAANVEAFDAFLDGLRELRAACTRFEADAPMRLAEFYAEVLGVATDVTFIPPGPAGGVPALDAGQARQLDFDHVFVLGMTERSFPRAPREDALYADDERLALNRAGVPLDPRSDAAWEDSFAFYAIAVSARERLTLSYPVVDAEGREVLPSYFVHEVARCFARPPEPERFGLAQMVPEFRDVAAPGELLERSIYELFGRDSALTYRDVDTARAGLRALAAADAGVLAGLRAAIEVENRRDARAEPDEYDARLRDPDAIAEVADAFGPETPFSPSGLAQFGNCPFAFFADRVLGLQVLEDPTEDVDAMLLGSVIHRVLSHFFADWRTHREDLSLREEDLPAARAVLDRVIDRAFADEVNRGAVADRVVWEITREETRRDLHLLLEFEAGTVQADSLLPVHFEVSFGMGEHVQFEIGSGADAVRLRGRIDRVDLPHGEEGPPRFAVYDYKLGGSGGGAAEIMRGTEFQLPIYAKAVRELVLQDPGAEVATWAYYRTKRPPGLSGKPRKGRAEELIEIACANALAHAAAIRTGRFTPAPRECRYCDFRGICRWDEQRFERKGVEPGG